MTPSTIHDCWQASPCAHWVEETRHVHNKPEASEDVGSDNRHGTLPAVVCMRDSGEPHIPYRCRNSCDIASDEMSPIHPCTNSNGLSPSRPEIILEYSIYHWQKFLYLITCKCHVQCANLEESLLIVTESSRATAAMTSSWHIINWTWSVIKWTWLSSSITTAMGCRGTSLIIDFLHSPTAIAMRYIYSTSTSRGQVALLADELRFHKRKGVVTPGRKHIGASVRQCWTGIAIESVVAKPNTQQQNQQANGASHLST
ncbi:hypothetical protein CBL_04587 [Carabus blaptoides fortunei]